MFIMQANDPSIAGDENPVAENLSFEELLASRINGEETSEGEPEHEPEETEEETVESEEDAEDGDSEQEQDDSEESEEDEEEEPEGKSDIDLLDLSPEQIQELAKKGKSRLLQRVGELTAQKKALEEKLATLPQPQAREVKQEDIPDYVRELDSAEKIAGKYQELEKTLEDTDALLEEHEDYHLDDLITVGDQTFTKRQIRQANKNARNAITKFLPAQAQHIAKLEQFKALESQYVEAAKKEVPEIADENSEIGKNYKSLMEDPLIRKVKESIPEIGFQIEYIIAHASRSIFGNKAKPLPAGAGEKLKASPPSSPVSSGAAKTSKNPKSKAKEAYRRFEMSGSIEDLIAARTEKYS